MGKARTKLSPLVKVTLPESAKYQHLSYRDINNLIEVLRKLHHKSIEQGISFHTPFGIVKVEKQ